MRVRYGTEQESRACLQRSCSVKIPVRSRCGLPLRTENDERASRRAEARGDSDPLQEWHDALEIMQPEEKQGDDARGKRRSARASKNACYPLHNSHY
jgi:hypothetical protein